MTKKIALITGANKGIGFATAQALGREGVTVLMGARSPQRGKQAVKTLGEEGIEAEFVHLDVTDEEIVAAAAKGVEERYGRLDILVNNAGIALADGNWNTSELTVTTARKVFEANVFGVIAVTNAFLPLVRRSAAGRIVNVSSEVGSIGFMTRTDTPISGLQPGAYGSSKTALNMLTASWAIELKDTRIKINAVTPGYTATDLNNNQGFRKVEDGARIVVQTALLGEEGPTGGFFNDGDVEYLDSTTVPW
jgi:NAD(P)-dependent dehydrogenase (short-subunit alcohol dehydrogenase family)